MRACGSDGIELTTYGRSSGFCIDPIEKKPLNHFYPGTPVLSFGTAGCNLSCRFCQNWNISASRRADSLADEASPEAIALAAQKHHCKSVAFTYNDPVIFLEYAIDVARACHALGIKTVAVTAGEILSAPRREFFSVIDAANIDLKSFSEDFYKRLCGGRLQVVLDTLLYLAHETEVWFEITTLLIPGENDSDREIDQLSSWVRDNLGTDVPLHFSAFYPAFKMMDHQPTPAATLTRAREIALDSGLHHVFTGNVNDEQGQSTYCSACDALLIGRDWYQLTAWNLDSHGACTQCGQICPGRFDAKPGNWGNARQPVRLTAF